MIILRNWLLGMPVGTELQFPPDRYTNESQRLIIPDDVCKGELSYLAPLGSENISAPYFKQCFFRGGGYYPPDWVKHHASQSQDRNNKYFILYIEFCINNKI